MKYGDIEYDCLIFDVDNVLIETSLSFPWVIRTAIQFSWRELFMGQVDGIVFTWDHFRTMKQYPYFNDDYDIAWILLEIAASNNIDRSLVKSFPSVENLQVILKNYNGEDLESWMEKNFGIHFSRNRVRKICAELYYGQTVFEKITGKEPFFVKCPGFWRREKALLKRHWKDLGLPVGIYTGRFHEEYILALDLLNWQDLPLDSAITADSGILKPSSEGLSLICSRIGSSKPLYFGDAESDRQSLINLGYGNFIAIGNVIRESELRFQNLEEAFRELGI